MIRNGENLTVEKRFKKTDWPALLFYIGLIILPVTQVIIFYIVVRINSVFLAFQTITSEGAVSWAGFLNFRNVIHDFLYVKNFGIAFKNSFLVWILGTTIKTPLCLFFCYFIYKKCKFGKTLKILLFAPSIFSAMVTVTLYEYFCEAAVPELILRLTGKSIGGLLSTPDTRFWTIFTYGIWIGFGSSMLLYINAMESISESVVEASELDGVNSFQEFIHITFPLIFSTFAVQLVLSFAVIFGNQFHLFEFYGLYAETDIQTIGYYMYAMTFNMGELIYPQLSAMGLILTIIIVPATVLLRKAADKLDPMLN